MDLNRPTVIANRLIPDTISLRALDAVIAPAASVAGIQSVAPGSSVPGQPVAPMSSAGMPAGAWHSAGGEGAAAGSDEEAAGMAVGPSAAFG